MHSHQCKFENESMNFFHAHSRCVIPWQTPSDILTLSGTIVATDPTLEVANCLNGGEAFPQVDEHTNICSAPNLRLFMTKK